MGRWGWRASVIVSRIVSASKSINNLDSSRNPPIRSRVSPYVSEPRNSLLNFRSFSALPVAPRYVEEFDASNLDLDGNQILEELLEDEEAGKISVKAFFLCTRFIYCFIDFLWNVTLNLLQVLIFLFKERITAELVCVGL